MASRNHRKGDMKRLLVYTQQYAPDSAALARIYTELCEALRSDFSITVICSTPRYAGRKDDAYRAWRVHRERRKGVEIIRVPVPAQRKSRRMSRALYILAYFLGAWLVTLFVGRQDVVMANTQPPVLNGVLGTWAKRVTRAKLIYNIQDFNPEQIKAVGYSKNRALLGLMLRLDNHTIRRADALTLVDHAMIDTLDRRIQTRNALVIPNWIDETQITPLDKRHPGVVEFRRRYGLTDRFVVMYSGNLGLYYGLEPLIRIIGEYAHRPDIAFAFVGDGAVKPALERYCDENALANVFFIPYQPEEQLIDSLNAADVHIVSGARGTLGVSMPCKIYAAMAVNAPVLGILERGGDAWNLIEKSGCGVLCEPDDEKAIRLALKEIVSEKERFVEAHAGGRAFLALHYPMAKAVEAYRALIRRLAE